MTRIRIFALTAVVMIVFGISIFESAAEEQKTEFYGVGITTKMEQMEVGDVEGHVILLLESEQVYFNKNSDQKFISTSISTMDINMKTGMGFVKGYGVSTYADGEKSFRSHEGKPVGKGHWKGTWVITGGTGKYKDAKGGGAWDSKMMSPKISYYEIDGKMVLP